MKASELSVGDSFPIYGERLGVVTKIQDTICYDKPKRTIVFDIYTTGLFPERIGWSWYAFFDVNTDLKFFSQKNNETFDYD